MMNRNLLFKILFTICIATTILIECADDLEKLGVQLRPERIVCKSMPNTAIFTTCNVKFISRTVATLNIMYNVTTVWPELKYRVRLYYKYSNNQYRPFLIDVTTDFCDIARGKYESPTQALFIKVINPNNTNIWKPCPISPGNYYIKDLTVGAKDLPSIFPEGRYLLNITLFENLPDKFINFLSYFKITNYGLLDLQMG